MDATLSKLEMAEGLAAAKAYLAANFPTWQIHMVPEAKIEALVAKVVQAVDAVRASDAAQPAAVDPVAPDLSKEMKNV